MNLYKKCLQLSEQPAEQETNQAQDGTLCGLSPGGHTAVPQMLHSRTGSSMNWIGQKIYYISDIHLAHKVSGRFKEPALEIKIADWFGIVSI